MDSKIHAFMKTPLAILTLAFASFFAAGPAAAERADRTKPMNVEADAMRYDDANQTSVFTGRVVVTKGTIVIRGSRITVKQDPDGFQSGVVTSEPGKPAFFRQKRDGVDEYMEGEAETIEYDGRADRVKFIGRAEMRRLRGGAVADETSGAVITYNNATDQFSVDGAPGGATPANPGGRVRATLAPRGGATTPAAPASAPAAQLRPSTGIGGERR